MICDRSLINPLCFHTETESDDSAEDAREVRHQGRRRRRRQIQIARSTRIRLEYVILFLSMLITLTAYYDVALIVSLINDYPEPYGLLLAESNVTKVRLHIQFNIVRFPQT